MTTLLTPPAGDPRTPAEYTYDMQRAGTIYTLAPEPVAYITREDVPTPCPAAPTAIDPIFYRAGYVTGQLTWMLTHELERAHAERLLTLLEAMVSPAPVRVGYDWIDEDDELNDEGIGTVAYTNYLAGKEDQGIAEITFSHRPLDVCGGHAEIVYMFHRDELPLSIVEQTLPNLLALLADPKVHAMRVRSEAGTLMQEAT